MKKRTCFYLSENAIERIKSLSVDSNPFVSQSAIVEYLILTTDNYKEGRIGKEKAKRKKETNS